MARTRTTPPRAGWRTALTAGLVVLLTAVVPGSSWAAWTAGDSATSTARAASVGITQQLSGSTLDTFGYSASTTRAVGTVTITNTSTREGDYTLTVTGTAVPGTPDAAAFLGAVAVEIGTSGDCTPLATLGGPASGTLASATAYTGELAAGASVVLCVRTTMTTAAITAHAGKELTGTLSADITVGTWTAEATPLGFAQTVAAATAHDPGSGWYWLGNDAVPTRCVADRWHGSGGQWRLWLETCSSAQGTGSNMLYRFEATSDGFMRLVPIHQQTRYISATGSGVGEHLTGVASPSSPLTEWKLTAVGAGVYQVSSRTNANLCWSTAGASTAEGSLLLLAACDPSSAAQRYRLTLLEIVVPPPVTLQCSTAGPTSWLGMSWPVLTGYQEHVTYTALMGGLPVSSPATSGYYTTLQLQSGGNVPGSLSGPVHVEVWQSVMGGTPTLTGSRTIHINPVTKAMSCP